MSWLVRLGLGGVGLKGWAWLGIAVAGFTFAIWLCARCLLTWC